MNTALYCEPVTPPLPLQTSNNAAIVAIYIIHGAVKYLGPQWGISLLFSPIKRSRYEDVESLSWAQKPVRYGEYVDTF